MCLSRCARSYEAVIQRPCQARARFACRRSFVLEVTPVNHRSHAWSQMPHARFRQPTGNDVLTASITAVCRSAGESRTGRRANQAQFASRKTRKNDARTACATDRRCGGPASNPSGCDRRLTHHLRCGHPPRASSCRCEHNRFRSATGTSVEIEGLRGVRSTRTGDVRILSVRRARDVQRLPTVTGET